MKKFIVLISAVIGIFFSPLMAAMDAEFIGNIESAMHGDHRSEDHKARNKYRHPLGTLAFFGLKKDMTVLEIAPGGGWYLDILAPAMRDTGVYIAASYDVSVEGQPEYRYRQHAELLKKIEEQPNIYGQIQVATYSPPKSRDLWDENSVDMVLTFRSSHGWVRRGEVDDVYADFYKVVKQGGISRCGSTSGAEK